MSIQGVVGGDFVRGQFRGEDFAFQFRVENFPRNSGHFMLLVHSQWRRSFPCLMALQQNWSSDETVRTKSPPPCSVVGRRYWRQMACPP